MYALWEGGPVGALVGGISLWPFFFIVALWIGLLCNDVELREENGAFRVICRFSLRRGESFSLRLGNLADHEDSILSVLVVVGEEGGFAEPVLFVEGLGSGVGGPHLQPHPFRSLRLV
jgi:hypothetical protein